MNKKLLLVLSISLFSLFTGCTPEDKSENLFENSIVDHSSINGNELLLFVQEDGESTVKSIVPWENLIRWERFDIINIEKGEIKASSIEIKPGEDPSKINGGNYYEASEFGYESLLLLWENEDEVNNLSITTPPAHTFPEGHKLYDLEDGIAFEFNNWSTMSGYEDLEFSIVSKQVINGNEEYRLLYASKDFADEIKDHPPIGLIWGYTLVEKPVKLRFYKTRVSQKSFEKIAGAKNNGANTSDDVFEYLYDECENYLFSALKDKLTYKDGDDDIGCEKSAVDASRENAKRYFGDLLLSHIDPSRDLKYPRPGLELDKAFVIYSEIDGLLRTLENFQEAGLFLKSDKGKDQPLKNFESYLKTISNAGINDANPSAFSHLILWYSEYLLYAGLSCMLDEEFFSRYFNYLDNINSSLEKLVEKVAFDYADNNIVIRYYAVATLYDFILESDRGRLKKLEEKLDFYVDDVSGEYGEGFSYFRYVNDILLPVLYTGVQAEYLFKQGKIGDKWIEKNSKIANLCKATSENLLEVSNSSGLLPAIDDGFNVIQWLAPMAEVADDDTYLDYTKHIYDICQNDAFREIPYGKPKLPGDKSFALYTYPYDASYSPTAFTKSDGFSNNGSINKFIVSNALSSKKYTDQINLNVVAQPNPEDGTTHDQIDHGAIQISRHVKVYTDSHKTTFDYERVNNLIIDPGYPGFTADKRFTAEFQFRNQNVQMLKDYNDYEDLTDIEGKTLEYRIPIRDYFPPSLLEDGNHNNDEVIKEWEDFFKNWKTKNTDKNPTTLMESGMSGYHYMSDEDVIAMAHRFALHDGQDGNKTEKTALGRVATPTLKGDGGGKSDTLKTFPNGVDIKINYHYKTARKFYYERYDGIAFKYTLTGQYANYEDRYYGLRSVYNLGNSFYVVDRMPSSNNPSLDNIHLATSWNMPENSSLVTGRPACVRGSLSDSRIEIDVLGATNLNLNLEDFRLTIEYARQVKDKTNSINNGYFVQQAVFENNLSNDDFMISSIKVIDRDESFRNVSSETSNANNNVTINTKIYTDNSKEIIVHNPQKQSFHFNETFTNDDSSNKIINIRTDAKFMVIHLDEDGNGIARCIDHSSSPMLNGHTFIVNNSGGQSDIQL